MGLRCTRSSAGALLATITSLILSLGLAAAQDTVGLTPSFGDGRLTVAGGGFRPGERVTLTVRAGGTSQQFMTTADTRGQFRLATGLTLSPGASVQIEARGDQGTTQAAITSAPGGLPLPPGPEPEGRPSPGPGAAVPIVPEADGSILLGGGLAALGAAAGLRALRRRRG